MFVNQGIELIFKKCKKTIRFIEKIFDSWIIQIIVSCSPSSASIWGWDHGGIFRAVESQAEHSKRACEQVWVIEAITTVTDSEFLLPASLQQITPTFLRVRVNFLGSCVITYFLEDRTYQENWCCCCCCWTELFLIFGPATHITHTVLKSLLFN